MAFSGLAGGGLGARLAIISAILVAAGVTVVATSALAGSGGFAISGNGLSKS